MYDDEISATPDAELDLPGPKDVAFADLGDNEDDETPGENVVSVEDDLEVKDVDAEMGVDGFDREDDDDLLEDDEEADGDEPLDDGLDDDPA